MLPTNIYTFDVPANGSYRLLVNGQYFKILAASGLVTVQSDFGKLKSLVAGQGLENTPFPHLLLTDESGAINTVRVLIGDENFIDGMTGNVGISSNKVAQSGAFSNVQKTVTNASAQAIAANALRQYLLIQNKDNAGTIYINFGAAATLANGIKVGPGAAYELTGPVTTQAIYMIGDIASNANVLTVEG